MSWTDDRVDILKKLWGEGRTAAEIAKELGGVTRNAVIGKAHRLKLSNRVSPIQQNNKKPVTRAVDHKAEKSAVSVAPVSRAPTSIIEQPSADIKKINMIDLNGRQCRWPYGDPREKDFGFCGCESMAGLPYCEEHAKLAYQAATRNRILQSEDKKISKESTADSILKKAAS